MKKIEIKELGLKSVFKVTMYVMIVPLFLLFLIGAALTVIGALLKQWELLVVGVVYLAFPVFLLPFYGAINTLIGLIYNTLSKKFGGLEVTIDETDRI